MDIGRSPARHGLSAWAWSVVALVAIALAGSSCGGEDNDPASVMDSYVEAYNAHDLFAVMDLWADDAVMTGHPFAARAEGIAELTRVTREDIANAASTDAYQVLNFQVDGNTLTFDHIYHNSRGGCFTGGGHKIAVEDGKLVRWDWGVAGVPCD